MTTIKGELPINLTLRPIKCGADYYFTIIIQDDNRVPIDTTGYTCKLTGKVNNSNGEQLFQLTTGAGITHTPAQGKFVFKISHTVSATFNVSSIFYDIQLTTNTGDVVYPFEGKLPVKGSATK